MWPSEWITIGLLFALKDGSFRAFYRWLARDYATLFGGLPERTRLLRALRVRHQGTTRFLAEPTSSPYAPHVRHQAAPSVAVRAEPRQGGRKGWSNHRWVVGLKLWWLINCRGEVVAWDWNTANRPDQHFAPVAAPLTGCTITLADEAFRPTQPRPANLKLCPRGTWNECMFIETVLSLVHRVCRLKYLWYRARPYLAMHLACVTALFNALLLLTAQETPLEGALTADRPVQSLTSTSG